MPIAFRSIAGNTISGSVAGDQTLVINKPAGAVDGDVMVAVIGQADISGSDTLTAPAGWTALAILTNTNGKSAVFYKVAASEGASYSLTVSGGGPYAAAGLMASYSGADTAAPIAAIGSQHNASSVSATAPSVAPSASGDMLVCLYATDGAAYTSTVSSTPPAGMTERGDVAVRAVPADEYGTPVDVEASLNDLLLGSTSPTGAKAAALSEARENNGFSVLLRPAGAPPPPASAAGLHMVI